MRAVVKTAPGVGRIDVIEAPMPVPGPGEALVRVGPSGLCGTDLLVFDGRYRGRNRPMPCPLVIGHEASGEVIELGAGTSRPAPGTRVAIEAVTGCGACYHCLRGKGHSLGIASFDDEHIHRLAMMAPVSRMMVRQPNVSGNAGSFTNGMPMTASLGCGTWGGNITSENISVKHYMNTTWVSRPIAEDRPTEQELLGDLYNSEIF